MIFIAPLIINHLSLTIDTMSLKIDRVQLEIIVQQDKARQQMLDLEKQMRDANRELKSIKKQFGENSVEYRAQQDVIRKLKQQYDDLFNEIGIGHLSLKELANRQRELNAILRNMDPSLPEWKQYNEQLKAVNARIKELRGTATETGLSLGKLADGFNRYAAIGASAIATLTGMTLTMRKCVDEYATMEEAESQVIKYTGMTAEEVKQLNEEFKRMDTRTPREELNRLAGEAGKLGITGVQEVREFVEAANQINVALGEDLGEEAVNQIGKLSQMFGAESRSLKENMLAIGSAVNQVAQSTSASEPYLVQFTARMGGVGKQAKMSVTDIMGFASALDQNMLRSEMASTALSGLIMRIFQEPAKYAKLAGMDVEEFTKLVETDVNEAVMSFLSALNRMGGMSKMAPVLKEMQLSGAEAASVISTLAGNVDLVRREQENANKAFTEGTSITNEYNVQNNTVQARLEKLQNDFKNIRVELGERLLPVMRYMISTGSLTVKGLMAVTEFLMEYKREILTTVTAIAAYTAVVKAHTIATKAMELGTKAATIATRAFNAVTKTTPWGLIISGITAVVSYFVLFRDETDKSAASQKAFNEELERTNETMNRIAKVKVNAENIQFLNPKQQQQLKADAQREIDELDNIISQGMIANKQWYEAEKQSLLKQAGDNEILQKSYLRGLEHDLLERMEVIEGYIEEKKKLQKIVASIPDAQIDTDTESTPAPTTPTDPNATYKQEMSALEQRYREEQNLLKKSYIDKQLTQQAYEQQMYALESAHLEARKTLMEKYKQDTTEIQGQIYDRTIAEANQRYAEQLAQQKAAQEAAEKAEKEAAKKAEAQRKQDKDEGLQQIKETTDIDRQLTILQAMYDKDLINFEEYQEMKTELEEQHEQRRSEIRQQAVEMIGQAASAASQLFTALQDRETSQIEADYDKKIETARKAGKDTTKLEEEKEEAINAVKKKYADKQFAMNILQITSDTAAAIMRAWKQMGVLAPIYTAIVAAQGAIQIAVAKQQRDQAKGLKSGGYSRDYIEGYTAKGDSNDTAGVIPVHKNEFVANHEAVANPAVKQFLDVFDLAQKRGTIRMLNTTQILEQVRTRSGRYSGGYTDENTGASRSSASPLPGFTAEQRSQVVVLLEENNRLLTVLAQKELVVDPRKVRDGIKRVNQLERNVSR